MSLKKILRRMGTNKNGQVVLEYFILLTIVAAFAIISSSVFFAKMNTSTGTYANAAFNKMGINMTP